MRQEDGQGACSLTCDLGRSSGSDRGGPRSNRTVADYVVSLGSGSSSHVGLSQHLGDTTVSFARQT